MARIKKYVPNKVSTFHLISRIFSLLHPFLYLCKCILVYTISWLNIRTTQHICMYATNTLKWQQQNERERTKKKTAKKTEYQSKSRSVLSTFFFFAREEKYMKNGCKTLNICVVVEHTVVGFFPHSSNIFPLVAIAYHQGPFRRRIGSALFSCLYMPINKNLKRQ